jgi:DNA-binding NarL/FixJ family response regulator
MSFYRIYLGGNIMNTITKLEREQRTRREEEARTMLKTGYTISEIARVMELPESTVRSLVYNLRK